MAIDSRYKVPLKRRVEGRTDYQQRLELLKSGLPRLVVRKSNSHVTAQVVSLGEEGDETLASAHSSDLSEHGWDAPTSNTPASYLVGYLVGGRAINDGVDEAVLDVGLQDITPGNRVFAALKGAVDAGLDVPHGEEVLPSWERIRGEHIAGYAEYTDQGIESDDLPEHFDEVLESMEEEL